MDLNSSLYNYKVHLDKMLENPDALERFKKLSDRGYLGCFCEPNSKCHVDIILDKLKTLGLNTPKRQCVKVKYMRKDKKGDNLEEWCSDPKNELCTRRGRVFIGSGDSKRVYHYTQSEWCNPYKVK